MHCQLPVSFHFLREVEKKTRFILRESERGSFLREEIELRLSPALKRDCIRMRMAGGKNVRLKGKTNTPLLYESEIEFSLFQLASELIKSRARRVFP